ncbi:MAG: 16S rRNA (guanine(527)-N(7))-methyltransferase RsmG [Sphingopyxis sp.]|nr:16S rRNA (guanine(527)-N(7))-methyltransferase RsmG [Sphingopyxis sp.]
MSAAAPIVDDAAARDWLTAALAPTPAQWAALELYADMLRIANAQQNLVAASTIDSLWARHIADSAQLLCLDARGGDGLWLDLGSGAGLPGLVAGILTERPVLLVESRALRCQFLEKVIAAAGLGARVRVAALPLERVETRAAATISARAFAPLDKLINLSSRFSTVSTRWLLPKGRNAVNELALLPAPWQKLFHVEQSLTNADSGILVGVGNG